MKTWMVFLAMIVVFIAGFFVATPNQPSDNPSNSGPDPGGMDEDSDKVADYQDDCFGTPLGTRVDDKGCPISNVLATQPSGRVFRDRLKDGSDGPEMVVNKPSDNPSNSGPDPGGMDEDSDKVADYQDDCFGTPLGTRVDDKGCPISNVLATRSSGRVFWDRLKDGSDGPEMVVISAGRFRMGDIQGGGYEREQPVHSVSVEKFEMGRYEVTVGDFRRFVNATGYQTDAEKQGQCYTWVGDSSGKNWRNLGFSQTDTDPVVCVSWNDATAYTEWLSQQTGQTYRLPTEAQWEYVARAGTETQYWWGNDIDTNLANCDGCGSHWDDKSTAPVGSFAPNPFGLDDTVGKCDTFS